MKNNSPRRIARKILLQNRLCVAPDYKHLQRIIESNQFTIIKYNKRTNSEDVSALIKTLGIENEIQNSDCFLYLKNNLRFIFLNSDVSDEEKCLLLCHELGHILDPALDKSNYSKIKKEEFANEFSCYIKNPGIGFKLYMLIIKRWKLLTCLLALSALVLGLFFVINSGKTKETASLTSDISLSENSDDIYYITSAGEKYHRKNCITVKYRNNLTKCTLDEALELGYKPCLICLPDEK